MTEIIKTIEIKEDEKLDENENEDFKNLTE